MATGGWRLQRRRPGCGARVPARRTAAIPAERGASTAARRRVPRPIGVGRHARARRPHGDGAACRPGLRALLRHRLPACVRRGAVALEHSPRARGGLQSSLTLSGPGGADAVPARPSRWTGPVAGAPRAYWNAGWPRATPRGRPWTLNARARRHQRLRLARRGSRAAPSCAIAVGLPGPLPGTFSAIGCARWERWRFRAGCRRCARGPCDRASVGPPWIARSGLRGAARARAATSSPPAPRCARRDSGRAGGGNGGAARASCPSECGMRAGEINRGDGAWCDR